MSTGGTGIGAQQVVTDDGLKRVYEFAEGWDVVSKNLDPVIDKLLALNTGISKANGTTKLREETDKLAQSQIELSKINKQIEASNSKNNAAYIQQVKALEQSKRALKDKIALGDREAKTVTASNSSIKQLSAALNKNRQEYDQLSNAEKRAGKEGKDLLLVIKQQDTELKSLKEEYGQNQLNVGNYEGALKSLKDQLKSAQDELVGIARTLGTDSKEFSEAAEKAGELKNEIGDLRASVDAVSGSKFENIAKSAGLVGQKLKAMDFRGANVAAKQLLSTTKGLTFKEAIAGIGDFGKTMARVGASLLLNPIFLLAAALVGIGVAINKLKDNSPLLAAAFKFVGDMVGYVVQQGKDFLDWIGLTTFALDEKANKTVEGANREIEAVRKRYDQEIKIASAAGKEVLDLEIEKNKGIIKEATKGLVEIDARRKRYHGEWQGEDKKHWDELISIVADANVEIQALQAAHDKEMRDKAEARRLQELGDLFKLNQFILKAQIEKNKAIADNEQKAIEDRIGASSAVDRLRKQLAKLERDNALEEKDLTSSALLLIEAKYQKDLTDITKDGVLERSGITKDFIESEAEKVRKRVASEKALILKQAEEQAKIFEQSIQTLKEKQIEKGVASVEVDKQIAKQQKAIADDLINNQIEALGKILLIEGLTADERVEIEKQMYKLRTDLTNAYYDNLENREKTWAEKSIEFINTYKDAFEGFINSIADLSAAFTERRLQDLEIEQEASDEKRKEALDKEKEALATRLEDTTLEAEQRDAIKATSDKKQAAIEKEAEKRNQDIEARRRKAIRKQAIFDKAVALSMGGIKLAEAVLAMLTAGPGIGFILAAAAAAIGAVQLATIAAKPIPAAEHGIKGHKGGLILAGEAGTELVKVPGKDPMFTHDQPTLYNLPKGTDIYPAGSRETLRALATAGLAPERMDRQVANNEDIKKELRNINRTLINKPQHIIQGQIVGAMQNQTRMNYINKLRNRA